MLCCACCWYCWRGSCCKLETTTYSRQSERRYRTLCHDVTCSSGQPQVRWTRPYMNTSWFSKFEQYLPKTQRQTKPQMLRASDGPGFGIQDYGATRFRIEGVEPWVQLLQLLQAFANQSCRWLQRLEIQTWCCRMLLQPRLSRCGKRISHKHDIYVEHDS